MNKIIATMAVAALAAWAAPASAGTLLSHPGKILTPTDNTLEITFDHAPFFINGGIELKLSFDYDGNHVEQPCADQPAGDCLTMNVSGLNSFDWLDNADISDSMVSFGPQILNEDGQFITMTWTALFNRPNESVDISNIKLRNLKVSEPAPLALFGLGLAGLGFMRRKRSA